MSYGKYPDLKKVNKILVIKMRHHGDVLLSSPLFSVLKNRLPNAQIDAYIYEDTLPMLEGHPGIKNYFLYDRKWKQLSFLKKLGKELSLLWKLRKEKYDMVINLTEGDRGAIAAKFCNSPIRVGLDGKRKVYTHVVKYADKPRHTVEKHLDVLRVIGIFPTIHERDLTFIIPKEAEKVVEIEDYILIHPVSRWMFKSPPPSFFIELIPELLKKGKKIALTSSPDPKEMAMLEQIIGQIPPVYNFGGKTTLKELGALVKKASCLITVDSVPLHMASALKTPVIAIFGPTSETNWGPWMHPKARVVAQNFPCRPCFKDGCAGSKLSDCLYTMRIENVLHAYDSLFKNS